MVVVVVVLVVVVVVVYSSLFVKKNDSIEKIKKNVTKLQKNKLRNLNKYTT